MNSTRIAFTHEDQRKIASAATWGLIVSVTSLVTGLLTLLAELAASGSDSLIEGLLQASFTVMINIWLLQASLALRKVASTTNTNDQGNLLIGFRKLRAYFMAQVIVLLLVVGVIAIAFLFFKLR